MLCCCYVYICVHIEKLRYAATQRMKREQQRAAVLSKMIEKAKLHYNTTHPTDDQIAAMFRTKRRNRRMHTLHKHKLTR